MPHLPRLHTIQIPTPLPLTRLPPHHIHLRNRTQHNQFQIPLTQPTPIHVKSALIHLLLQRDARYDLAVGVVAADDAFTAIHSDDAPVEKAEGGV